MEVAIHLPEDVVAAVLWDDIPRHILEQITLEKCYSTGSALLLRMLIEGKMHSTFRNIQYGSLSA